MTAVEHINRLGVDVLLRDAGVVLDIGGAQVRGVVTHHSSHFAPLDSERQGASIMVRMNDMPDGIPFATLINETASGIVHRVRRVDRRGEWYFIETEITGRTFTGPMKK